MRSTDENTLNLIEIFLSVQGETSWTGLPTAFVRLARCNLRCTWCDTTYSFGRGTPHEIDAILQTIHSYNCSHVCVTGGEPLLQPRVHSLMTQLCDAGYGVSLETGGSLDTSSVDKRVKVILDVKCPGSAMEAKNEWQNLKQLQTHDEVKFVVQDRTDYDYAKDVSIQYGLFDRELPVLLSPVFGVLDPKLLVEWMLKDQLHARLNLQIHKYIWSPETKGV